MARIESHDEAGFSIIEVVIAMILTMVMALHVAPMFSLAIKATQGAREQTSTTILAAQKMEQLRALTWGFDRTDSVVPVSDTTSDLTRDPAGTGGPGLNPSPAGALSANTAGYVDYLDARGRQVGTGASPPAAARFIRRWSIDPLPPSPNTTLILQVLVTTVSRDANVGATRGPRRRHADDALIVSVKTRKAW